MNPIDAGYEEEEYIADDISEIVSIITGSGITLVYELPLATVSNNGTETELDGYDLAEYLASPSDATPSNATPSNATPSNATPSVAYYNAGLEDMVKAPDYEEDAEPRYYLKTESAVHYCP